MEINSITSMIIEGALKVHSSLGPGLLESAYSACLKHELSKKDCTVLTEVKVPLKYDSIKINTGYRIDFLVNNLVIIELKSVTQIAPIHRLQLLTYLKLNNNQIGLLLNFNVLSMKDGIIRIRNSRYCNKNSG